MNGFLFALFSIFFVISFEKTVGRVESNAIRYVKAGEFPWYVCIYWGQYRASDAFLLSTRTAISTCVSIMGMSRTLMYANGIRPWKGLNAIGGSVSCDPKLAQFMQRRSVAWWTVHPLCLSRRPASRIKRYPNVGLIIFSTDFIVTPTLRPLRPSELFSFDWDKYANALTSILENPNQHNCYVILTGSSKLVPQNVNYIPERFTSINATLTAPEDCLNNLIPDCKNAQCGTNLLNLNGFCVNTPPGTNCDSGIPSYYFCDGSLVGYFATHTCRKNKSRPYYVGRLDNLSAQKMEALTKNRWIF